MQVNQTNLPHVYTHLPVSHPFSKVQVLLDVILHLFICVFLRITKPQVVFQGGFAQAVMRRNASASHQQVAHLGQGDELLVSWGAHVQADRQHLLQSRHDQRGLNGVELATPLLVPPLLVLASGLVRKYLVLLSENQRGLSPTHHPKALLALLPHTSQN